MRILAFTVGGPSVAGPVVALLVYVAVVTVPLVVGDVQHRRLSNRLVMPGYAVLAVALVASAAVGSRSVGEAALALAVCLGVVAGSWLFAVSGAFGMGDVKLAGLLGGALFFVDSTTLPRAVVIVAVLGGVWASIVVLRAHARGEPWRGCTVPFGVPLLAGFWGATVPVG